MVRKMGGKQNENLKKLICAGIVILAIAGCAKANFVDSNTIVQDGIEYYMQTDKAVYDLGENVEMLYRVTNLGNEDVTFGFTAGPVNDRGDFIVEENGESIWDNLRRPRLRVLTQFTLSPLEFRDFTHLWDMTDSGGHQVTPGNYDVTGALGNLRLAYMDKYIPVSVPIQIIPEPAMIYHVDADANGLNDGSSWADAYNYLQDALADANSGDEIRVAEGIYRPDRSGAPPPVPPPPPPPLPPPLAPTDWNNNWSDEVIPGDRTATFQLKNGVTIKGGYAGFGEPDANERDIDEYETILSGDIDGNDIDVNEPWDLWDEPTRAENSFHVVTGSNTDSNAVLDGFTITGGNANSGASQNMHRMGAGMTVSDGSPTLTNCTFTSNSAEWYGGGMFNSRINFSPTLTNCTFSGNYAGRSGGGMFNNRNSPTLKNCTFIGNLAGAYGGGMSDSGAGSALTNCTFIRNSAIYGGAIDDTKGGTSLANCMFISNSADYGGVMFTGDTSFVTLTNCTFAANSATLGNAVACDGMGSWGPAWSNLQFTNCILSNGGNEIWINDNSVITIRYSDVQGGWPGEGNIDADPCFTDPGYWGHRDDPNIVVEPNDPNAVWIDGDYRLLPDSPCINAGDPNYVVEPNETDLDGKPRVIGGRIDMGAYEYRPSIPAEVRIIPRSINLASKGKWITCYIWLDEDYDIADIDPNSVVLEDEIGAESVQVDEDQQIAVARFSRSEVQDILAPGEVELTVSGELTDGTRFEGTDTIRVIDKGGGGKIKD